MKVSQKYSIALICALMFSSMPARATDWKKVVGLTLVASLATLVTKYAWCTSNNDVIKPQPTYEGPRVDSFPSTFLWGAATSSHQVEGRSDLGKNIWHIAEEKHIQEKTLDENGQPLIAEPSGDACNHYDNCMHDIELIKQANLNSYRFSIAWEKVEPQEGVFNQEVLKHYADFCIALIKNNITPVITLHHYADPIWFAEKGAFLHPANISLYHRYAQKVIEHVLNALKKEFSDDAQLSLHRPLWFTFNSPSGYVAKCYLQGVIMPYEKGNLQHMAQALKNMVQAHVGAYRDLKEQFKDDAHIGIMHNTYQLDPLRPWNPIDNLCCKIGNALVHDCILNFFTTGHFNVWVPTKVSVSCANPRAIGALDFIGLNYYSHTFMRASTRVADLSLEETSNANYRIYPQGLYRAIEEISHRVARPLNIPIYVTENGIGTHNDAQRERFFKGYLSELSRAIADGHDVRGYIHWSLMDNYEWGTYAKKYGMYAVDFKTQQRMLKPGAQYYVNLLAQHKQVHTDRAHGAQTAVA